MSEDPHTVARDFRDMMRLPGWRRLMDEKDRRNAARYHERAESAMDPSEWDISKARSEELDILVDWIKARIEEGGLTLP